MIVRYAILLLALCFSYNLIWAADRFPTPVGWEANLKNVKISDVIAEFSPSSELAAEVETKYKTILAEKGYLYKKGEGNFSILTPSVHCSSPYIENPSSTAHSKPITTCEISLTLRERVAPSDSSEKSKERIPSGIVGTFYAHYPSAFPSSKETIVKALDRLFDQFLVAIAPKS
jgi:hypothetical protein